MILYEKNSSFCSCNFYCTKEKKIIRAQNFPITYIDQQWFKTSINKSNNWQYTIKNVTITTRIVMNSEIPRFCPAIAKIIPEMNVHISQRSCVYEGRKMAQKCKVLITPCVYDAKQTVIVTDVGSYPTDVLLINHVQWMMLESYVFIGRHASAYADGDGWYKFFASGKAIRLFWNSRQRIRLPITTVCQENSGIYFTLPLFGIPRIRVHFPLRYCTVNETRITSVRETFSVSVWKITFSGFWIFKHKCQYSFFFLKKR